MGPASSGISCFTSRRLAQSYPREGEPRHADGIGRIPKYFKPSYNPSALCSWVETTMNGPPCGGVLRRTAIAVAGHATGRPFQ
jgi:hypothetical protein